MVLRSSDRPTTVPDTIEQQQTALDSLHRDLGRGGSALRAGHNVVQMNPDAGVPVITPVRPGSDVALTFASPTQVAITDPAGGAPRDFSLRHLSAAGNLSAGGSLGASGNVTAGGVGNFAAGVTAGQATINGQLNLAANLAMGFNQVFCGTIHSQNIECNGINSQPVGGYMIGLEVGPGGIVNHGGYSGAISERRLKTDIEPATGVLDEVRAAPVYDYNYRPDAFEGADWWTRQRGVMADDLPEDCVIYTRNGRAPEMSSMVFRAWGAVQELAAERDALADEVTELRSTVAALSARLDALEAAT